MKIKPKKSLGQNFLIDDKLLELIANIGEISTEDTILEVGAGTGNLTEKLIYKQPKKIIAIEKDENLCKILNDKFSEKKNIKILNENIMKMNEEKITNEKIIIYGNLPYNISTQILAKWIKLKNLNKICKKMILMFQKEVANRIIAKSNTRDYGRISIFSSWKCKITKIRDIKPSSFYPKPKIESTILLFEPKDEYFEINKASNLEYITNIFFNQRRKMIKKPIKLIFKNSLEICKKLNLNENNRPQNLSPNTYYEICREYEKLTN